MMRCSTHALRRQLLVQGPLPASLALSSLGALSISLEPACRREAVGSGLKVGPTEGNEEGAADGAVDEELVQRAAPTLELGAVLVLLVKGSTACPGPRRPRRGDGRRGCDHGPGLDHGRRPHHLGGLQHDLLLLMSLVRLDSTLRFCPVKGSAEISSTVRDGRRQHPKGSSPEGGHEVATVVL